MTTVSALIATYNRAEFLDRCLESLYKQTYGKIEIVVVDDGSTDGTKPCGHQYRKIPHGGISRARNEAMAMATGEVFFIIDSDDTVEPTCIEKELDLLQSTHSDLVFCELNLIDPRGVLWRTLGTQVQNFDECWDSKLMPHGSSMFRRSLVSRIKYDESLVSAVDYDFLLSIMVRHPSMKISKLDEPLYNYYFHDGQEADSKRQLDAAATIRRRYSHFRCA